MLSAASQPGSHFDDCQILSQIFIFPNIPATTIPSHYGPGRCRVWLQILLGIFKSIHHVRILDFYFGMTVWSFSMFWEKDFIGLFLAMHIFVKYFTGKTSHQCSAFPGSDGCKILAFEARPALSPTAIDSARSTDFSYPSGMHSVSTEDG